VRSWRRSAAWGRGTHLGYTHMTELQYRLQRGLGAPRAARRARTLATLRPLALSAPLIPVALLAAMAIDRFPEQALALPALGVSALVASRYPAAALLAVVFMTGTSGSIRAFTDLPVVGVVDVILGGLWFGVVWSYIVAGRKRPLPLWPAVLGLSAYLIVTLLQVVTAGNFSAAIEVFRGSAWNVAAGLMVAYGPWSPETLKRVARGVVVVAALVGGYAVLRHIIGPAQKEVEFAAGQGAVNLVEGEERLFGSLPSRHALGVWSGVAIPFLMAFVLGARGRWRLLGIAAGVACAIGLLGSHVRVGIVGVAAAVLVIAILYQFARAFRALQASGALAVLAGAALVGGVAFSVTVGESELLTERYERIADPSADRAAQQRVDKWRIALDELERDPLGKGLGSAGRPAESGVFSRFQGTQVLDADNGYLQLAIQQGVVPAVLFGGSILALIFALGRRAVGTADRESAQLAIGAAGTLTAFGVFLCTGSYADGLPALLAWIIVGVGVGQFVRAETASRPDKRS
jgi:hypothetical protein